MRIKELDLDFSGGLVVGLIFGILMQIGKEKGIKVGRLGCVKAFDLKTVGQALPVGRIGEADEVAQTYLYFMKQSFSTGQSVVVDGGNVLVQRKYIVVVWICAE